VAAVKGLNAISKKPEKKLFICFLILYDGHRQLQKLNTNGHGQLHSLKTNGNGQQ